MSEGNVLLVHFLAICEGVAEHGGGVLLEHPADPEEEPMPSIWATQLVQAWEVRIGARRGSLDQCMYGGPTMKPTTVSGNLVGLEEGELRCDGGHRHESALGKVRGVFRTRRLQTYPPRLCRFLRLVYRAHAAKVL